MTHTPMATSSESESELIGRIIAGEKDLFGVLFAPHEPVIRRKVLRLLACKDDADDVLQDVRWKALAHLSSFRFEASLRTWLVSIAVNEARMRQRLLRRYTVVSLDEERKQTTDPRWPAEHPHSCRTLEDLTRREASHQLSAAMAKLPEKYRAVITLRYAQEASVAETAEALMLSVPAVKSRQLRACKMLRKRLYQTGWSKFACLHH